MNTVEYIARAARETGFVRERFDEDKIPTTDKNISVFVCFGDLRQTTFLATVLLPSVTNKWYNGRYLIVCSWPGWAGLFPYADEYWSLQDGELVKDLRANNSGLVSQSVHYESVTRNLRKFFEKVDDADGFASLYDNGLSHTFLDEYELVRYLPSLPTAPAHLNRELFQRAGNKLFFHPATMGYCWHRRPEKFVIPEAFWQGLVENLLERHCQPVLWLDAFSYDLSRHFGDRCLYVSERNILSILASMRATGCVLDCMTGLSKLAAVARTPFIGVDDRQRHMKQKEFEIDDLLVQTPKKYIFYFSAVVQNADSQEVASLVKKFQDELMGEVDKDRLPSVLESCSRISYEGVRRHKAKRLGMHFIKVEKLVI